MNNTFQFIKKYGYYQDGKKRINDVSRNVYNVDITLLDEIKKINKIGWFITSMEYAPELKKLWIYDLLKKEQLPKNEGCKYTKKAFVELVKKEDTKKAFTLKELKTIYDNLKYTYGEVTEENFDVDWMLKNVEQVKELSL